MDFKGLFFKWMHFSLGAGGALLIVSLLERIFEKLFNLIEGNIKIEDMVLRDIEKENEKLEDEVDRLKEELKDLENKNKLLKNIYFDRTIEEVQ